MANIFSNDSRFALYNKEGFVRSTDYPGVNIKLYGAGNKYIDKLSDIPEQHLSGIRSIEVFPNYDYNDYEGVYVEEGFKKKAESDLENKRKSMTSIMLQFLDSDKEEPYIEVIKGHKGDNYPIIHEVGHHVDHSSGLSVKNPVAPDSVIREIRANDYASSITKGDNLKDEMLYASTLQEIKNPSIDELIKVSGVEV